MNPSPAPWEYENVHQCSEQSAYGVVKDADGKILFDTLNSDVACIETEYDEDGVNRYDTQGMADLTLAAAAPELLAALKRLLPHARADNEYLSSEFQDYEAALADAKAAVTKAEGRTP